MPGMIKLLVPTAASTVQEVRVQARPTAIRTLAFLHNGQPHYDVVAADLLAAFKRRPDLAVREYRKPHYGNPAEAAVLDDIARTADAAFVGLAC